jgi:hypothetical protein
MDVETLNFYGHLMGEIKYRLHFVRQACEGKLYLAQQSQIPGQMQREFAYVQLRYIMEVLAIGLVALYDNKSEIASLVKEWSANDIIKRLDRLNPARFPSRRSWSR